MATGNDKGRFYDGRWYCDCKGNPKAKCFTVKQLSNKNHGKQFWTCAESRDDQCGFFIWVEDEARAKAWLTEHQPPIEPKTPTSKGGPGSGDPDLPKEKETPWTKAKRKPVSREVSDENENGGPSRIDVDDMQEVDEIDTPSRKVAKLTRFSTPGQSFIDKLKNKANSMPTPESGERYPGNTIISGSQPQDDMSPVPTSSWERYYTDDNMRSDLSARVLSLIRSDKINLKGSTLARIRHEIETEVEINTTRLKICNETIMELSRKLDEKERQLLDWIGDATVDDPIELSD